MADRKKSMSDRIKAYTLLMEDPEFRDRYARVSARIALLERDLNATKEYVNLTDIRLEKALKDLQDIKEMLDQDQKRLYQILNNETSDKIY